MRPSRTREIQAGRGRGDGRRSRRRTGAGRRGGDERDFLPTYIIEPPDTLIIDTIRLVPRPPYRIEALDILIIQVADTLPGQPIAGPYPVTPEGIVFLGYSYGSVRVAGLTLEQAAVA